MVKDKIDYLSEYLINKAKIKDIKINSCESCSGGMIISNLISVKSASSVINSSLILYSNYSKAKLLNIDIDIINKFGAVSYETAKLLAIKSIIPTDSDISIATTGIAGPSGATKDKMTGLVFISSYNKINNNLIIKKYIFAGNRNNVRLYSNYMALRILWQQLDIC